MDYPDARVSVLKYPVPLLKHDHEKPEPYLGIAFYYDVFSLYDFSNKSRIMNV